MPRPLLTRYRIGPLHLVMRNGGYHVYGTVNSRRYRVSARTADLRQAKQKLRDIWLTANSEFRPGHAPTETRWRGLAEALAKRFRHSARTRGIPFDLTPSDVFALLRQSGFRCSVSGIELTEQVLPNGSWGMNPWGPSLDRIDNRAGYLPGNVRITCVAANLAMNAFGFDVLLRLAHGVVRNATTPTPELQQVSDPIKPMN